ncbi:hypothetical protein RHGRI_036406 [Rhododendron griersonianum]|uniref:Uncharacterized protein n=1 Tax=Rhododendron griersonianum TaxID=479676 RepID=A0AAV6HMQ6_9ERIC|nr:hypothetical protein RHGRI_036406 [Rhododendron griersonianum]
MDWDLLVTIMVDIPMCFCDHLSGGFTGNSIEDGVGVTLILLKTTDKWIVRFCSCSLALPIEAFMNSRDGNGAIHDHHCVLDLGALLRNKEKNTALYCPHMDALLSHMQPNCHLQGEMIERKEIHPLCFEVLRVLI